MAKHTRRTPAKKHLLPFEEWMRQRYPDSTPARQVLRMIGAFDLLYLLYRTGLITQKEEPTHEIAPIRRAIRKTAAVTKPEDKTPPKRRAAKATRRTGSRKKSADLTLEFHEDEPTPLPARETKEKAPEPQPAPEPEPLVLEDVQEESQVTQGAGAWLNDERLEDIDLRKTKLDLSIGDIGVGFETRVIDDEDETVLVVRNTAYRVSLSSPPMNLGSMLQVVRATYGELYVLGRAALGALSGEGYIAADEAERIVRALDAVDGATELEITYADKDAKTRNRTTSVIRVRFEPL